MARTRSYTFNRVAGLNKAIRELPKEAKVELRDAGQRIADRIAPKAAAEARSVGGVAKYVAGTIKARRDTVPKIVMGGMTLLPARGGRERGGALADGRAGPRNVRSQTIGNVVWGAEFGSDRFRQFSPWRGNKDRAGYFLWPTVRAESDEIMEEYGDALLTAIDKAASRSDG